MTVDEQLSGWYTMLRQSKKPEQISRAYWRLTETVMELASWPILPYTLSALQRYEELRKAKLNVGAKDLKIGAIALEHNATVVSRNLRDFQRIPGVDVEDWSV
jgi:tRNA(fMet)-specific endonuclease VapC